jgi:uncharacterized protein
LPEVICDTSPLQYLHQLGLLHLLPALASRVVVPPSVNAELSVGRDLGVQLPDLSQLDWVTIRRPVSEPALPLVRDLGAGETEALMLALEHPGTIVVLDDALARRVAESLRIPFTGTLGILLDAKKLGLIQAVQPQLARLQELGFRLSAQTRSSVLNLINED